MVRQSLTDSIEALKDEDFDCASGFKTDIYLDPEAEKIYTFLNTNAVPATAYHGIDRRILSVKSGAIAISVYNAVKGMESDLDSLIDSYEGSEWDGSNHKGKWSEDAIDTWDYLEQRQIEIAYYWEPSDWFSPVIESLKSQWQEGKTAEEIIDSEGCGNEIDGMCDRSSAISWLNQMIEEWAAEAAEEDEEE